MIHRLKRPTALLSLTLAPMAATPGQVTWAGFATLERVADHAMAADLARGRLILFTGSTALPAGPATWAWDGIVWTRLAPATTPPARSGHCMAYDAARQQIVMFGGPVADTWEWDGTDWHQRTPAQSPPARQGAAMAFDAARGRTVLHGGYNASAYLNDVWEWDGSNWTNLVTPIVPPPRYDHAMAYHPGLQGLVMFGGRAPGSVAPLGDTWGWSSAGWQQLQPASSPPPRAGHAMGFDPARGRIVLFGGAGNPQVPPPYFQDTWEFDGVNWTQRFPATSPSARADHALAFSPRNGLPVLLGGVTVSTFLVPASDTWAWDGSNWSLLSAGRSSAATVQGMTYDAVGQRVLLCARGLGGSMDVWESQLHGWRRVQTGGGPVPRDSRAFAWDERRGRAVLFGGHDNLIYNDTWEWDGSAWQQRAPALSPPERASHAMVYDPVRGRMVLFGGDTYNGIDNSTWSWDGTNWALLAPAAAPTPRGDHAMAFDRARGVVVLFGGRNNLGARLDDTWTWDGQTWTQRTPVTRPAPRGYAGMAYDSARERIVLFGGESPAAFGDTWEWDGQDWRQRQPAGAPAARSRHGMAYDVSREVVVLDGGLGTGGVYLRDTWELAVDVPAGYAPFGVGCAGSTGVPTLTSAGGRRPWLGDTFRLDLGPTLPGMPGLLYLGRSRTGWGPFALPLELGFLGAPGCYLRVSPDLAFVMPGAGTSATFVAPLPLDPGLLGVTAWFQGLCIDPAANALGVTYANGVEVRLGAR